MKSLKMLSNNAMLRSCKILFNDPLAFKFDND